VIEAHDIARSVLAESGFEVSAVAGTLHDDRANLSGKNPFDQGSAADIILALVASTGTDFTVESENAQLGIVSIDPATCTLCGQCAKVCPTNALGEIYVDEIISISFDAMACVNCDQCVGECPEIDRDAISVRGMIDTVRLDAGRCVLNEGTVARCEICGTAFAPAALMDRISDVLGDEFQDTVKLLETRCLDCRGR
jgi:ferredoxin